MGPVIEVRHSRATSHNIVHIHFEPSILNDPEQKLKIQRIIMSLLQGAEFNPINPNLSDMMLLQGTVDNTLWSQLTPQLFNQAIADIKKENPVIKFFNGYKPCQYIVLFGFHLSEFDITQVMQVPGVLHAIISSDPLYKMALELLVIEPVEDLELKVRQALAY